MIKLGPRLKVPGDLPNGARMRLRSPSDSVPIKRLIRERMVWVVMTPRNDQKHCTQVNDGGIPAEPPRTFFPHRVALFLAASFASFNVSFVLLRRRTDASLSRAIDDRLLMLAFFCFFWLFVLSSTLTALRKHPPKRTTVKTLILSLRQFCWASPFRNDLICSIGAWISAADPINLTRELQECV